MKVTAIMATCGRHTCCERSLRFFLEQDYPGLHDLIIYQNSDVPQELSDIQHSDNKSITLVNNHIDPVTGQQFATLGAIYNAAMHIVPEDSDVIIFWDDDDIFLPNHIREGVNGLQRAYTTPGRNYLAYKPKFSYYRAGHGISLENNTMEPSIFVNADFIKETGFYNVTSRQHLKWVEALVGRGAINQEDNGIPTMCYNWGDREFFTHKTSGHANADTAFNAYRQNSLDHGDQIITPYNKEEVDMLYTLFNTN